MVILAVWIASALYSSPKFIWVRTVINNVDGTNETVCVPDRQKYNSKLFDMINFALLYVIPLAIMTVSLNKLLLN